MDCEILTPPDQSDRPARAKLTPRLGWFKLHRADLARIRELGEVDGISVSIPVLIAVWSALCDIANEKRTPTFEVGVGIIRKRSGISRRTAFEALKVLETHLKMISHTSRKSESKPVFETNIWTVFQSIESPSANGALGKQRTRGSAKNEADNSHKGIKKPLTAVKEEKYDAQNGQASADAALSTGFRKGDQW